MEPVTLILEHLEVVGGSRCCDRAVTVTRGSITPGNEGEAHQVVPLPTLNSTAAKETLHKALNKIDMDAMNRQKVAALVLDFYNMPIADFFSKEFVQDQLKTWLQGLPNDGDVKVQPEDVVFYSFDSRR